MTSRLRATIGRRLAFRLLESAVAERERRTLASCRSVGSHTRLRMPVVVYAPENLIIGHHVDIGEFVVLRANGGLTIGDRVLIASHAVITTRGHPDLPPRWARPADASVAIEDDVWLGAGAIVLPGVVVGRGSIVAAGAVVTRSVPPLTLVAGVPARPLRSLEAEDGS